MKNYKNGDSEPSHDASLSSVVNLTAPDLEKVRNNEDAFETNDQIIKDQDVKAIPVKLSKRSKIIWGVSIGIFGLLVLAGIAGIIAYSLTTQAKKPFTFLATNAAPVTLSQLSLTDFVSLVTAPNSATPQPPVTASFSGNQIMTQPGAQFFFKFDESPSSNQTLFVDDSMINGTLTYASRYISYQDLAEFNVTSTTGSEGIRIIAVIPVSPATIIFRVVNATETQIWDTYEGQKYWYEIKIETNSTTDATTNQTSTNATSVLSNSTHAHVNVTDLSSAIFANYISAPNAVIRKPLLGVAYNGTTFKLSVGDQMFFKFNVNPTTTGLNLDVDDKEINGGFTYIMAYKTYADINDFLPTPVLDTEGVRMYGLTAHKVGSFTFRLALVQFSTYNGNWDGYQGDKWSFTISVVAN